MVFCQVESFVPGSLPRGPKKRPKPRFSARDLSLLRVSHKKLKISGGQKLLLAMLLGAGPDQMPIMNADIRNPRTFSFLMPRSLKPFKV